VEQGTIRKEVRGRSLENLVIQKMRNDLVELTHPILLRVAGHGQEAAAQWGFRPAVRATSLRNFGEVGVGLRIPGLNFALGRG
jgi:hypothetical protein